MTLVSRALTITSRYALFLGLALLPAMTIAAATDLETEAKGIESRLMSPCCMTNTVDVHESGKSNEMRREIREFLAAGKTEREILDLYVEQYGLQILSIPDAKGFSLVPYLFPVVFVILGAAVLLIAMRRWRGALDSEAAAPAVGPPIGPYAERLKRDLEELD
jgi:cytochrome c-type biogenesis protein CcmH